MEQIEKQCSKCGTNRSLNGFRKYNETNTFSSTCKKCLNEMDKLRKKNVRQIRLETFVAKCEKCSLEKPLKDFAKLKKFYKKKICLICYPSFLSEQKTVWCKNEHNTNMNYRIKKSLAARLRNILKKNDTTMNYIGCNIQYFREWLEYNFTTEMNWDNYGAFWSIDHIIPVCKFDLTDEIQKLQCWNWSNMMPVSIKFNSSKKNIDMEQINYIIEKIQKFKEEGSTTKWFSSEFILNKELVINKQNINSF
uniref:Uncharacterized protein n=1 Tax=viral metagenome TaxID=1070528 RepID=A0A6C0IVG6_9ZZZZ